MRSVLRLYAVLKTSLTALLVLALAPGVSTAFVCPQDKVIQPCRCSERSSEIQIWCSYGDLNAISNALKQIGQLIPKVVDELILENNLLPSLPGQMFSSVKILRLMLRENGLQRVSANWLAGSESMLQEIYIVEPELRSFPDESLVTLPKLEALTLSAGLITKMPAIFGLSRLRYIQIEAAAMSDAFPNNFQGLPFLEQLHITSAPKIRTLNEDFVHDLPKLSVLNFTSSGLTYVHSRAFQRLPALTELSFTGNKFTDARLVGMAIRDMPNLATVRLDRNNIIRLEEGSFVDMPSLRNLYLNDNKITHIHRAAFHRLPHLRSLDLSNNQIRVMHPETFLPARDNLVEELWLNHNNIEHAATIRMLLDSLPNLRLLDLSNNLIEELSYGTVQGHMHLEMLILDNNRLQRIGRESFTGMPSLRELKLRNNSLAYHLGTPYWNLPALKGLDLSRNHFEHIDRFLLNGLPSLRRFDVSHNALRSIEPATFAGSPFLEHVNISKNDLNVISPLTFAQLQKLFDLDVSYNNLSQGIYGIPSNIEYLYMAGNNIMVITSATMAEFQNSALKLLDLSNNKIHKIPVTSLNTLCTLRTLLLNDNSLQVIDQSAFESLPQLRVLNLANNKLILVKKDSFKKLQHLNELNLGKNRLETFEPELLSHNHDLKKLDVSANRLTEIASSAFTSNKKIEDLNLSENSLVEFPSSISGMSVLQSLNLSRNQLKSLPMNVLSTLPALKELYLSGNKFQQLSHGVFERLTNLSMLDLESNEIERVSTHALHSLPNLVMVKMAKNKITSVSRSAFDDLPVLQSVELQENNLQDVANEAFTACPSLLMLNLSHNQLSTVEKAGLNGLRTLEALDLSHNRITRLSGDSVRDMNFLVLLKLDNNRLCNIEGTPFEKMSRLRMLSLRDNKMTSLAEPTFSKLRSSILYFDIEGNPVKCSCNMLWLQSWLQQDEQRHPGPRCSDGILLREHRMSRHNCDDVPEIVPGCETRPAASALSNMSLTSINTSAMPGKPSSSTPSPITSVAHMRGPTAKPQNHLKPLPEETDYFDPKFIEYHENNSKTNPQNVTSIPPGVMSHFIPGDTPTLYAGARTKPNVTKNNPPPAQGSSAFTFFGMPLPSLNLNNFWNSGKSADKPKKHGRHEAWPPSEPEIQKDGFVPMLPGIGGFVPMNVTPADRNSSGHHATGHATIAKVPQPHNPADEVDDFFAELESPRTNRNVSHRDSLFGSSTLKPTIASGTAGNRSEKNRKQTTELPKPTFISEPVFSGNERVHEDSQFSNRLSDLTTKPAIVERVHKANFSKDEKPENNTSPSSLSEFLIPGGEVSTASSIGRAVVSKVQLNPGPSPHTEDAHSSHLRLAKSSLHSSTTTTQATTSDSNINDSMSWYFANYNRSNIEPYVGRLPVKVSTSDQNHPLLPLFLIGLSFNFVF